MQQQKSFVAFQWKAAEVKSSFFPVCSPMLKDHKTYFWLLGYAFCQFSPCTIKLHSIAFDIWHSVRMCCGVSPAFMHSLHRRLSVALIINRCLYKGLRPVRIPMTFLRSTLFNLSCFVGGSPGEAEDLVMQKHFNRPV